MVVGGTDSPRIRKKAAREFMEWGFDAFETRYLFNSGQVISEELGFKLEERHPNRFIPRSPRHSRSIGHVHTEPFGTGLAAAAGY